MDLVSQTADVLTARARADAAFQKLSDGIAREVAQTLSQLAPDVATQTLRLVMCALADGPVMQADPSRRQAWQRVVALHGIALQEGDQPKRERRQVQGEDAGQPRADRPDQPAVQKISPARPGDRQLPPMPAPRPPAAPERSADALSEISRAPA